MCVIYGLCDASTGQLRYVGKTTRTLAARLAEHISASRRDNHLRSHLLNWLRQMHRTRNNIDCFIIEYAANERELNLLEMEWIAYFKYVGCALVNGTKGGEGMAGKRHTVESKLKMSKAKRGVKKPPRTLIHRQRLRNARQGTVASVTARAHMSAARKGKHYSPLSLAHRESMSHAHGGKPFVDQNGNAYISLRQAAEKLGLDSSAISKVLHGKLRHTKHYVFTFVDADT